MRGSVRGSVRYDRERAYGPTIFLHHAFSFLFSLDSNCNTNINIGIGININIHYINIHIDINLPRTAYQISEVE